MSRSIHRFDISESNGVVHSVAYHVWKPSPSDQKTMNVICVHGLTRNARDFDVLAEHLANTNKLTVYCLDVVGRGESAYLDANSEEAYGYPLYIKDAFAFVNHLGLETVDFWIGTSMGGLIGMFMCAQNPKIIRNLVLNDIGIFIPASALVRLLEYLGKDPHFDSIENADAYLRDIFKPFGSLPDSAWRHMTETSIYHDAQVGKYRLKYDPRIRNAVTAVDVDIEPIFLKVESEILLLRGEVSDMLPREVANKMKSLNSRLTLVEFAGIGHAPSLMVQDQIDTIQSWILARI